MKTSRVKFPRRVRIHGGECGAVARALHHAAQKEALMPYEQISNSLISDEKALLSQAGSGKRLDSTLNERKQMSTKTSIKRIALVAVSALGFGVFSVVPAKADAVTNTELGAVAITTPSAGRVGNPFTSTVTLAAADSQTIADNDDLVLRAVFLSRPAGSTAVVGFTAAGTNAGYDGQVVLAAGAAGNELLPARMLVVANGNKTNTTALAAGSVGFIPDVVGSYVVRVWNDANGNGLVDAAEDVSADTTFTVGNAPASVSVTRINSNAAAGTAGSGNGALVRLTLLDSAGAATGLAANETIVITPPSTHDVTAVNGSGVSVATGAAASLVASDFIGGVSWLNLTGPASSAAAFTISATGAAIDTISGTFTIAFRTVVAGTTATTVHGDGVTSVYGKGLNSAGTITTATMPLGANTVTYTTTASTGFATGDYALATITDSNGRVTGASAQAINGLKYDLAYLLTEISAASATKTGSFSVSVSASTTAGQGFNVVTGAGTTINSGVTAEAAGNGTLTVSPSTAIALKNGDSITYTVTHLDQFGNAKPNVTVTLSGGSRNAVSAAAAAPTAVTNALGQATFTIKDAPSAAALAAGRTTDAFTFTATGGAAATAGTITWSATGPVVGTVTILGGNNGTTTGVASTTPQWKDINAGVSGASGTTHTAIATVRDASGNLLAGVPVTFTVSGTTAAVTSTTQTVYTGATGTATANVYAWVAGSYTVTATAGGKTGTSVYQFRQSGAGEERAISASVSGAIVTAKVVDRFGNPVPAVTVWATEVGDGYFGTGQLRANGTTDNSGEVQFLVQGGAAQVTVYTYDPATAVAPLGSGQTCARAGAADCNLLAADDTAFTAFVAGTATANEKGVGSTFSAAGVSSATVSVTASAANAAAEAAIAAADAAAEAIDAANAATDAANLAAEAADAATVAAEEARDAADAATAAVEELATQVATLMAALKAQITTLANTVAKIAKKVRA